jgi:hypothetical protein
VVLATLAINLVYQFWLHTELIGRLGPLEWFLNTPSHIRVHHATNPEYLDRNFGGVLIVFDRIFGTFAAEREAIPCRYGLVQPLSTHNLLRTEFHVWRRMFTDLARARGPREIALTLVGPPEWHPAAASNRHRRFSRGLIASTALATSCVGGSYAAAAPSQRDRQKAAPGRSAARSRNGPG